MGRRFVARSFKKPRLGGRGLRLSGEAVYQQYGLYP